MGTLPQARTLRGLPVPRFSPHLLTTDLKRALLTLAQAERKTGPWERWGFVTGRTTTSDHQNAVTQRPGAQGSTQPKL